MSETRFFEQKDGSEIAYRIFESETINNEIPLVLIMGLGGTKEIFMGYEEELAKNQKVIVFDNRGIGESTVVSQSDPITIELMAQDTTEFIKHLGIKKFNLFGGSMGGHIALHIALNIPPDLKLEKLVVGCGFARHPNIEQADKFFQLPEMNFPKTVQEQKDWLLKSEKSYADYLLEHPDKFDKIAEYLVSTNDIRPFEICKRQWEAVKKSDLTSRLHMIKVPTLIIHGEADELVPIKEAELLDREIPNTQLYRIPKVGHSIYVTAPETTIIVNEFLNKDIAVQA
ncbi:alpha/beta hydrolase [Gigaspora margarita]|uniref:Alpha/beta hydrolase n=1 Tax=Gigaspora margarita TaxID=4874 RepID=A0A8H4AA79_GIGMA|nr:alpha/beta hydrolase [Gigaspora margarita]